MGYCAVQLCCILIPSFRHYAASSRNERRYSRVCSRVCGINTSEQQQLVHKKHIPACSGQLTTKTAKALMSKLWFTQGNDPVNLRLFKAFYIQKCKPELKSCEECIQLRDQLLFWTTLNYFELQLSNIVLINNYLFYCVLIFCKTVSNSKNLYFI